ncbi:MAG: DNA-binding protein [Candidatus Calescibacterium sp.]|nr:DNA-binding protein [Candidatus Calescibacterium sp.]MCX7972848.1 DNA-binding protein [bacterium]MDW8195230.1 DNA-binding protein [Candidatus Calescibacterium sp.]
MKFYESSLSGKVVIVRIDRDEEVISTLFKVSSQLRLESGFFQGIGAVKKALISFYDYQTKSYLDKEINQEMEVLSLLGNISYHYADDKPFVHAHIVLSDRNFNLIGGHLKEAIVGVTLEIVIFNVSDRIERVYNQDFNLFLWKP